jgi:hypothetical protein
MRGAQKIGVASGDKVNSDVILESTGPRLYSSTFYGFLPEELREQPYPGELQARCLFWLSSSILHDGALPALALQYKPGQHVPVSNRNCGSPYLFLP